MQFSSILGLSAAASVATAAYSNTTLASTSTAVVLNNATTVITITSCEENKCTEVPVTTGVTVVTTTKDNVVTVYTTWCPIPSTTAPVVVASTTKPAVVASTTEKEKDSTTVVTSKVTSVKSQSEAESTTAKVSTYAGSAGKVVPAVAAIAAGVALLI